MDLAELQETWDKFGVDDPFWAILTSPNKRHGRWDLDEFFASGKQEISTVIRLVNSITGSGLNHGRALDFGSGVGRLTQALAEHFDQVDGVDIAPSMVDTAGQLNQCGDRCRYHLNNTDNLGLFDSEIFDFVYSAGVLQYLEPRFVHAYIQEFIRVLKPDGIAIFQLPTEPVEGAAEPLPDNAFNAIVEFSEPPTIMSAGEKQTLIVDIHNDSDSVWPASGSAGWFHVTVGNHWSTLSGRRLVVDDARAALPHDVLPGEEIQVELEVTTPKKSGHYLLEADLCQEGVGWFAERGTPPAQILVKVQADRRWPFRSRSEAAVPALTRLETYGIAENTVSDWVNQAGGKLLTTVNWFEIMNQPQPPDWHRQLFAVVRND